MRLSVKPLYSAIKSNSGIFKLWLLLAVTFVFGGSSRSEVSGLIFLFPVTVAILYMALINTDFKIIKEHKILFGVFASILTITGCQLIPLPPVIWRNLPGRALQGGILDAFNLGREWMPLSLSPQDTWNSLYGLLVPVTVVILAVQMKYRDHLKTLYFITMCGFISCGIGILQASGLEIKLYRFNSEMSGLFANRNHQVVLIAITLALAMHLIFWRCERNEPGKLLWVTMPVVLILVSLVLVTGSRAGIILTFFALVISTLLLRPQRGPTSSRPVPPILWIAAVIMMVSAAWALTSVSDRNESANRIEINGEDSRTDVWLQTLSIIPQYMPWGTGVGTYAKVYQVHEPMEKLSLTYSNHAHNDLIEVFLEAGVLALIPLVLFLLFLVCSARTIIETRGRAASMGAFGLLVLFLVVLSSLVDYPLRTPIISALAAYALALASAMVKRVKAERS